MPRKPTGNPVGCPPKTIDWTLFEQLCSLQCTQAEIAHMLKVSVDTLVVKIPQHYGVLYSEAYSMFSDSGKCSLRRDQRVQAKRNAQMGIFLGKNWLGQTDGRENVTPPTDKTVTTDLEYAKKCGDLMIEIKELKAKLNEAQAQMQTPV